MLMMPWKLVADPTGYIFTWLIAYSALLGPIGGILIADYFVCRRCKLNVSALYQPDGEYRFTNGFSLVALVAFVAGVLPSLPGFLVNVKVLSAESVPPFLAQLYNYAWFIGFACGVRHLSCLAQICAETLILFMKNIPLPPTSHQPQKYTGPSADEVLALRKQFMNPGIFLYYKKPIMLVEGRCSTSGTKQASAISTDSAAS